MQISQEEHDDLCRVVGAANKLFADYAWDDDIDKVGKKRERDLFNALNVMAKR